MKSVLFLLLLCLPGVVSAQAAGNAGAVDVLPLITIGSLADEQLRLAQIGGSQLGGSLLIRSASSMNARRPRDLFRMAFIPPALTVMYNSNIPFSVNDGALWAGRGWSGQLMAGATLDVGRVSVILAPQLLHSQNRDLQIVPSNDPARSAFSSPWYIASNSMDLPIRFGNEQMTVLDAGQSSVSVDFNSLVAGAATENQWWGPGVRNAIVMSNHAAGFPHLFVRTARPVRTPLGSVQGKWIVGGLTESLFFDRSSENDLRSLSAAVVTLSPNFETDLTIGAARSVISGVDSPGGVPARTFDVFAPGRAGETDQLASLFFQWNFPAEQAEIYGEWSRLQAPRSLREFLTAPHHTQGYTLGLQWGRPVGEAGTLRIQGEATYLEMSSTYRHGQVPTYYVGRNVEQGYTQRGQVIGASIGPGSSSQWLAADYFGTWGSLGIFLGRIRWETDAYHRQPTGIGFWAHDVSVLGGLRGAIKIPHADLTFDLTMTHRYNYLFQHHRGGYGEGTIYDRPNVTLGFGIQPRIHATNPAPDVAEGM